MATMPTFFTLYTASGSFHAFPALIAAKYSGIRVVIDSDAAKGVALSPAGKVPLLIGDDSTTVFGTYAIARFLAGIRRDLNLMGRTVNEAASIDTWVDFATQKIELPACVWFYPVLGYMSFNSEGYSKARYDLRRALSVLEYCLAENVSSFLVGDAITLADIVVASVLFYPFKLVCDDRYLGHFQNVVHWFQRCISQPEFNSILGSGDMCKTEMLSLGNAFS